MLTIVRQWEGLLCSPLCVSGRVCCAHHCASVRGSAVLTIVRQWEGLLCSPLCVSGRLCCAHHCASVGGSAVLTIVRQWEGLVCSPLCVSVGGFAVYMLTMHNALVEVFILLGTPQCVSGAVLTAVTLL